MEQKTAEKNWHCFFVRNLNFQMSTIVQLFYAENTYFSIYNYLFHFSEEFLLLNPFLFQIAIQHTMNVLLVSILVTLVATQIGGVCVDNDGFRRFNVVIWFIGYFASHKIQLNHNNKKYKSDINKKRIIFRVKVSQAPDGCTFVIK